MGEREITYYLWKGKSNGLNMYHITDYKEIRGDGKVNIDGFGYIYADLVFTSKVKMDCLAYAQKLHEQQ